jgi:hypothetical protein
MAVLESAGLRIRGLAASTEANNERLQSVRRTAPSRRRTGRPGSFSHGLQAGPFKRGGKLSIVAVSTSATSFLDESRSLGQGRSHPAGSTAVAALGQAPSRESSSVTRVVRVVRGTRPHTHPPPICKSRLFFDAIFHVSNLDHQDVPSQKSLSQKPFPRKNPEAS